MNFTKRLVGNKFKYLYIKTFITFTKALYFSEELQDIELYLFFERFQNTIIAFNIVLGALKEFFSEAYCIDDDENEENKGNRKLYEPVYNEIRKLM